MGLNRERIIETLQRTKALPSFPAIILELDRELRSASPSLHRIVACIEQDPALTAQVLRVVRSGMYGISRPVTTVGQAVTLLGMLQVRRIVVAASVIGNLRSLDPPAAHGFWTHSLATALACQALLEFCEATLDDEVREAAFIAGLLHDVGVLVMHHLFPEDYRRLVTLLSGSESSGEDAEYELFGIDHAEIGMLLASRWNLPDNLAEAIGAHHAPWAATAPYRPLAALVHVANFACNNQGLGREGAGTPRLFDAAAWMQLGLSMSQVGPITERVRVEGARSTIFAGSLYTKAS